MTDVAHLQYSRGMGLVALWFGLLIGPIVWAIQMQIGFMLVPWACATGLQPYMWMVTIIALLISLSGALVSWRMWKQTGAEWPGQKADPVSRARFMAAGGVFMSLMFALAIIAQGIPSYILSACN